VLKFTIIFSIVREILQILQAVVLLFWIVVRFPLYNIWANCFFAGVAASRIVSSAILIAAIYDNAKNVESVGYAYSFGSMGAYAVSFVIAFIALRIYYFVITRIVKRYEPNASKSEVSRWSIWMLDIFMRLELKYEENRDFAEKLSQMLIYYNLATPEIYINLSSNVLIHKPENAMLAYMYLKKAFDFNPNFATKFLLASKIKDCEAYLTESNGTKEIHKMLSKVKQNEDKIIACTRLFWKELLNRKGPNIDTLSNTATVIDSYASESQRILTNLNGKFPKNNTVLRHFAAFYENIRNDFETASKFYAEADSLEEEKHVPTIKEATSRNSFSAKTDPDKKNSEAVNDTLERSNSQLQYELLEHATHAQTSPPVVVSSSIISGTQELKFVGQVADKTMVIPNEALGDNTSAGSTSSTESKRQLITHADPSCLLMLIILSITLFCAIFTVITVIVTDSTIKSPDYTPMQTACRQLYYPIGTILTYRREDFKRIYMNNTISANISSTITKTQTAVNTATKAIMSGLVGTLTSNRIKTLQIAYPIIYPTKNIDKAPTYNKTLEEISTFKISWLLSDRFFAYRFVFFFPSIIIIIIIFSDWLE